MKTIFGLVILLCLASHSFAGEKVAPSAVKGRKPSQASEDRVIACKVTSNLGTQNGAKFVTKTVEVPIYEGEIMNGGDAGGSITLPNELTGYPDNKLTVSISSQMHHGKPGSDGIKIETYALSGQAWGLDLTMSSGKSKISIECKY